MKDDNAEMAGMERQATEARERMAAIQEELSQTDQELEEQHGERRAKYRELKKREETMDAFLETFAEAQAAELARQERLQEDIVEHLERISRNLPHFGNLPSQEEMALLRDDLT